MKLKIQAICLTSVIISLCTISLLYDNTARADICAVNAIGGPPFLPEAVPPLVMIVMGRDHKLYYAAYNDASDLNNDGLIDVGYKPSIEYYGYFDSYKCYTYSSSNSRFEPSSVTEDKKCSGSWSGDFLNYLTMSRMDTIRKVLFGGFRSTDSATETVLQRVYVPQDAHSWGKEYTSQAVDGYSITDYAPLSEPMTGRRHFFASTTLSANGTPLLRVLEDVGHTGKDYRIWNWIAIERPVANDRLEDGGSGPTISSLRSDHGGYNLSDYTVRVKVCDASMPETNCKLYHGTAVDGSEAVYKPTGLLQKYGEGDSMYFGLMTGSYEKNMSGGVVRKNIGSISDEINPNTGQFTTVNGIIQTINKLRIVNFRYSDHSYEPGWPDAWITNRPMNEAEFPDWGNPIGEMMYETLNYFSKGTPTSDYIYSGGIDANLGLPLATWQDPFLQGTHNLYCAKPIMLVISDIYPSYDTDELPGSAFAATGWSTGKTLGSGTLNVQERLNDISSDNEGLHFVGQVGDTYDSSCSPKTISGLGNVRGLCPEEPTKQGGYYAGAVAHYGRNTNLRTDLTDNQQVTTFAVALSSPLPEIEIPVGEQVVTLVPFGKTVVASGLNASEGHFQPTATIVDFFVEEISADQSYGKFRINFEDVEQGADHDMDVIVLYEYEVQHDNTIKIKLTKEYQAAGYVLHLGYIISGTTNDGIYLEVASKPTGDIAYFLDTPTDRDGPGRGSSTMLLSDGVIGDDTVYSRERVFTPSSTPAATLLKNPLWYAAKWGGYEDGKPWDQTGDGVPDHYFFVANPLRLEQQLSRAFQLMLSRVATGSAASVISSSRRGEGVVVQAVFWPSRFDNSQQEVTWSGDVRALLVDMYGNFRDNNGKEVTYFYDSEDKRTKACVDGLIEDGICSVSASELDDLDYLWTVSSWLNDLTDPLTNRGTYNSNSNMRYIYTWWDANDNGKIDSGEYIPFVASDQPGHITIPYLSDTVIKWLRGQDQTGMRSRQYNTKTWRMGDVVHSSPVMVGAPAENYDLLWNDATYGAFVRKYRNRRVMAYFGSNTGMLHAVNAGFYQAGSGFVTNGGPALGAEMFAYVPYNLLPHLECLTQPNYSHQYFVDLRPRVFDVKIFDSTNPKYPGGWGTILVGGMRLGGGYIKDGDREFSSSFFVLDITDPDTPPVLLGETTTSSVKNACAGKKDCLNFGYTISVPTVVPVKSGNTVKWFLVLSTGPDTDKVSVESTQKAAVAVIPMEDYLGNQSHANWSLLRIPDVAPSPTQSGRKQVPNNNSFISTGMVSVDYDFDFFVDILYFGTTEKQGGTIGGGLQRLKVEGDVDPSKWEYKSMFDARRPVTGEPNVGWKGDDVWVYFGTGKFWTAADKFDTSVESIYCIQEPKQTNSNAYNFSQITKSGLFDVTNINVSAEDSGQLICKDGTTSCLPSGVQTFTQLQNAILTTNKDGAYRDLSPAGERVLGQPSLLGGLLNFAAYHPDPDNNICASEGRSKLYSLHYLTCTPWVKNVFGAENTSSVGEVGDETIIVDFTQDLGPGMTITPTMHLGEQEGAKVFIQTSTGEIISIDQPDLPIGSTRSGRTSWHMSNDE